MRAISVKSLMRVGLLTSLVFVGITSTDVHALSWNKELLDFHFGDTPSYLPDKTPSEVYDSRNMWFDENLGATKRLSNEWIGTCVDTTTASSSDGLWAYTDPSNIEWLVRLTTSGTMQATDLGACVTVSVASITFSVTQRTDAATGLGRIWFTNRQDGLTSWAGTSSGTFKIHSVTAPYAGQVEVFRNRVWLGDISNELSSTRASGELNGEDWTNNSKFSTSPVSFRIGGVNDGEKVYWIKEGQDELVIGKAKKMFAVYGNDQRDLGVRLISPDYGSIYPDTVKMHGVTLKFLSNQGLAEYVPPTDVHRIGDQVQTEIEDLITIGDSARSRVINVQSDWQLGVSSPTGNISTTLTVGSIRPSNQLFTDTIDSEFVQGVFDSNRITTAAGQISLNVDTVFYDDWNDGDYTAGPVWELDTPAGWAVVTSSLALGEQAGTNYDIHTSSSIVPYAIIDTTFQWRGSGGTPCTDQGCGVDLLINNRADVVRIIFQAGAEANDDIISFINALGITSVTVTSLGYTPHHLQVNHHESGAIRIYLDDSLIITTGTNPNATDSSTFYYWSMPGADSRPYDPTPANYNFAGLSGVEFLISTFRVRRGTPAKFTSRTFDIGTSSYVWQTFSASSANFANSNFGIQTSTDGSLWSSTFSVAPPVKVATSTARYVRWVSTLAMNPVDTGFLNVASIQEVNLGVTATGFYELDPINVGGNVSSWGLFTADNDLDEGTITYRVQSASCTTCFSSSWTVQNLNTNITIPINQYIRVQHQFAADYSTWVPTVNSETLNWDEGETPPTPLSYTDQDRWYLYFSTNTGTAGYNDRVLIYDTNKAFTQHSMNVGAVTNFKNKLTIGSPISNRIYTVGFSTTGTDDGDPFSTWVQFRRIDNGMPDAEKVFDKVYATISREDASQSLILRMEYSVNGSTFLTAGYLELSTGTVLDSVKCSFPVDNSSLTPRGKFLDLKLTDITDSPSFSIHRIKVYGTYEKED